MEHWKSGHKANECVKFASLARLLHPYVGLTVIQNLGGGQGMECVFFNFSLEEVSGREKANNGHILGELTLLNAVLEC